MPLPGTRVIHDGWSAHHRPVATGAMSALCSITRQATVGATGPDGTWTPPARTVVYDGPARVSPRSSEQRLVVAGDRRVVLREYIVAIRWDAAEVRVDDLVEVTAADDPHLPGAGLRVADVQMGGHQWERVLVCEENITEAGQ